MLANVFVAQALLPAESTLVSTLVSRLPRNTRVGMSADPARGSSGAIRVAVPGWIPLLLLSVFLSTGCSRMTTRNAPIEVFPDMDRQPRYGAQAESSFFADGRTARKPVPGTVAQGQLNQDEGFHTGVVNGMYLGQNPLEITEAVLLRGQERFNIYCAPCHDRVGTGRGVVGERSMWLANNLHDDRIKTMVDGEIFQVMSYGRRSMSGYRFQVPARDRWAIVAYVRALQRTTSGTVEDVPAELRRELR